VSDVAGKYCTPHHWVATACDDDEVLMANRLGDSISPLVGKQLKQLYVHHCVDANGEMEVIMVRCIQQPNASDCGVFATVFLFEWAAKSVTANLDVRFDTDRMRQHLLTCLERQELLPFPTARPRRNAKQAETAAVRTVRKIKI